MTYIQPLTTLTLLLAIIGLLFWRRRSGRVIVLVAVAFLFAVSWPPLEWVLSRPLESGYGRRLLPPEPADAIVVLASTVDARRPGRPFAIPDRETYERCEFAAWLHRNWRAAPVLACGGTSSAGREPVSVVMRELLERAGVEPGMIWTEERSRSTHENAVYGAELLRKHGFKTIVLVVEARSMPRAEACFRRAGIRVIPAPSSFGEPPSTATDWLPDWRTIGRNEITLHETLGLAYYKYRNWI
jgi:uncharacterized SAM-binding protein YcdF (DUF218 family)